MGTAHDDGRSRCCIAVPIGLGAAMYLSEYASRALPEVAQADRRAARRRALGRLRLLRPDLRDRRPSSTGWLELRGEFLPTRSAAGVVLGVMIIPTIASLSEDALSAVPTGAAPGLARDGRQPDADDAPRGRPGRPVRGSRPRSCSGMSRAVGETMILAHGREARSKNMSLRRPCEGHQTMTGFIAQTAALGETPVGYDRATTCLFAVALLPLRHHVRHERHQHPDRPTLQAGLLMSVATTAAREVTTTVATGRSKDRDARSLIFLGLLWFSLFFGVMVLAALIIDTAIQGSGRFDAGLLDQLPADARPGAGQALRRGARPRRDQAQRRSTPVSAPGSSGRSG